MHDVIVVGARCAGAATALLLARQGLKVLLLERVRFPKDTLSTLYIHQPGVDRLDAWGVLDGIVDSGCPPVPRISYTVADVRLTGASRPVGRSHAGFAPRRYILDRMLVEAAVQAGVEFRDGVSVSEVLFSDGRVNGVRCQSGQASYEQRAWAVIGADGMRSRVAHSVGARTIAEHRPRTCAYYTYWDLSMPEMHLYEQPGRWVGAVTTHDNATLIGCYFPQDDFQRIRRQPMDAYLEAIRSTAPELAEALGGRRPLERLYGTGDQQNFIRAAAGPGWGLVGDGSHHKDSITARGITDAFLQAQLLSDCVRENLAGGAAVDRALQAALDAYAVRHPRQVMDGYHATLAVAELVISPERLSVIRAVSEDPAMTEVYFSTLSGACDIDELLTDQLLERLGS